MNTLANKKSSIANRRGNAMLETLPILIIFTALISYSLGFFGVVHTAIMNSMAARTYAFETFRNRSDVTYFREEISDGKIMHYANWGNRFHTINQETHIDVKGQYATTRPFSFGTGFGPKKDQPKDSPLVHNSKIYEIGPRNRQQSVRSAWVMVGYGICLDVGCGD